MELGKHYLIWTCGIKLTHVAYSSVNSTLLSDYVALKEVNILLLQTHAVAELVKCRLLMQKVRSLKPIMALVKPMIYKIDTCCYLVW